jgi:biopolymer transport protein ExbD
MLSSITKLKERSQKRSVVGLRTRYSPRTRISQGLIGVGPWIDIILLVIMFVLFESKFVLHPGVVVEIPGGSFRGGTKGGVIAVVLAIDASGSAPGGEMIFFDDERFVVGRQDDMAKLKEAFARSVRRRPAEPLIIQADRDVESGTVMEIIDVATEVGVKGVNIATGTP